MTDRFDPGGAAPSPDGPRDRSLPMLSVAQAEALTAMAEWSFRAHGAPVTADGEVLRGGGWVFGLYNLAAAVAREPWPEWQARVERHAAAMVAARLGNAEDKNPRAERMYVKLQLPDPEMVPDYDASSVLPGLIAVAAEDLPTHVTSMLNPDSFRTLGTWEQIRELGLANLRRLPLPSVDTYLGDDERPDSAVHVLHSEDFFGASRVLVLDQMFAEVLPVGPTEHGCLVAVPNRQILLVHVLSGPGLVSAIQRMVAMATTMHDDQPGALTSALFYLPDNGNDQVVTDDDGVEISLPAEETTQVVTRTDRDGVTNVMVAGRFQDTFEAVVG